MSGARELYESLQSVGCHPLRAVPESQHRYRYLLGSIVCSLMFLDNVLRKMEAAGKVVGFWLALGMTELIFVPGVLIVVCQFLFCSKAVRRKKPRFRKR